MNHMNCAGTKNIWTSEIYIMTEIYFLTPESAVLKVDTSAGGASSLRDENGP